MVGARILVPTVAAVVLSGCAGAPPGPAVPGAGTVTLTREVSIPAGRARAVFEGGRQVDAGSRLEPHCEFEISTVAPEPQVVRPDTFGVRRIGQRVVGDEDTGMPPRLFGRDAFMCIEEMIFETDIRLGSDIQPGVRRLLCRRTFDSCTGGRFLSAGEIRAILGATFRLD